MIGLVAEVISGHESVLVALISLVGGGTLVPLIYSIHQRRTPAAKVAAAQKEEERSAHAAQEAVSAVRDVLSELRHERTEDKARIARLETKCAELEARLAPG